MGFVQVENRPISIDKNFNLAPRLRGTKQKKLFIYPSCSMRFLVFCSFQPRSQVRNIEVGLFEIPIRNISISFVK